MAGITRTILLAYLACTGVQASLKKWVGDGESAPWGEKTATTSHPQRDLPDTGETRHYDFTISRQSFAPDGVESSLIVCNGQFPGPTIEANWGDFIEVTVSNEIYGPEEVTTIHWHGLNQPGTPWYDGVPSVDQCPIAPGSSLKYRFRADEYGTSWWHSHVSSQYTQGLFGPMVIHGPSEYADYDEDLGTVMVNDWYHAYYRDIVKEVNSPVAQGALPPIPRSQSNLVNGAARYSTALAGLGVPPGGAPGASTNNVTGGAGTPLTNATAGSGPAPSDPSVNASPPSSEYDVPFASWKVEPGKKYRMRFINAGSVGFETISIDNHQLKIIANDFIPVEPYEVDHVILAIGQRTDVVFTASGESGESYWLRAWNDPLCGQGDGPDGRGIISYGDSTAEPTSTGTPIAPNPNCANQDLSLTVPAYPWPVQDADTTITINVGPIQDASGVYKWAMNGQGFKGDASAPLLLAAITQDTTSFPPERNVYNTGSNKTVRVILNNLFVAPHPMHIHGHDFQVLASGAGAWDGTIVRPENPQRRDTHMLQGGLAVPSYMVIQWEQDNPGIWPLHCHIAWHLSGGMLVLMLEREDDLVQLDAELPDSIAQICDSYKPWEAVHGATGDDTGLPRRRNVVRRRW